MDLLLTKVLIRTESWHGSPLLYPTAGELFERVTACRWVGTSFSDAVTLKKLSSAAYWYVGGSCLVWEGMRVNCAGSVSEFEMFF